MCDATGELGAESDLDAVNRYANNIGADLAVGTMALAEAAGETSRLCRYCHMQIDS
jgi:hypothetical protein